MQISRLKKFSQRILGYIDSLNIQKDDLNKIEITVVNNANEQEIRNRIIEIKNKLNPDDWNENFKFMVLTEKMIKQHIKVTILLIMIRHLIPTKGQLSFRSKHI